MKLTVFNGSPRGRNSNSSVLSKWIAEGAAGAERIDHEEVYLVKTKEHGLYAKKFAETDIALIIFPLYTDSLPGIVAAFIEELAPFTGKMQGRKLGFVVHSGFPEACHSRYVEKYLVRLTELLGADYMGTAVMGTSEPTRLMPESYQTKKRERFAKLGESMIKEGTFDSVTLKELARPERLTDFTLLMYKFAVATRLPSMYFKSLLKKNNALKDSFARPYVSENAN